MSKEMMVNKFFSLLMLVCLIIMSSITLYFVLSGQCIPISGGFGQVCGNILWVYVLIFISISIYVFRVLKEWKGFDKLNLICPSCEEGHPNLGKSRARYCQNCGVELIEKINL